MLTLLGSLLGFLSAGLPKVFEFFQQKEDNKLKTQMLQMQIEAAKSGQEFDLKVFNVKKDFQEQQMLLQHDIAMQGNWLSSSVRPIITYLFFFIFAVVKISMIVNAIHTGQDFNTAMMLTWDEETQAIFAAIISFWFGSRAMQKSSKAK